jgi:hypothetical protein
MLHSDTRRCICQILLSGLNCITFCFQELNKHCPVHTSVKDCERLWTHFLLDHLDLYSPAQVLSLPNHSWQDTDHLHHTRFASSTPPYININPFAIRRHHDIFTFVKEHFGSVGGSRLHWEEFLAEGVSLLHNMLSSAQHAALRESQVPRGEEGNISLIKGVISQTWLHAIFGSSWTNTATCIHTFIHSQQNWTLLHICISNISEYYNKTLKLFDG